MQAKLRRAGLPLLVAATVLLSASACGRQEPTFDVTTVVGNLDHPWDIAFTPDGNMLFTERSGPISVRIGGQTRRLATPTDVVVVGEAGMLGLAVDPNYATNRRIYTCFASNKAGLDIRIARWVVNAGTTALTNRVDILTGIPANTTGRHSGCRIRFGPDGYLWVGTGDAADNRNPQSPTSLGGKILRISESGSAAPGNAGAPFRPEIYNYGHRNVQGLAFGPGGRAYGIEHGTNMDDEVNLLVRGGNYGWDPVPPGGGSTYDETRPMTDLVKFPDAVRPVWSSGIRTIAPSGGTFITGSSWKGWDGTLAMAVLKDRQLRVLAFDSAGTTVEESWTRITDQGRLRVAVQGPDGALYIATDQSPGAIIKVTPRT